MDPSNLFHDHRHPRPSTLVSLAEDTPKSRNVLESLFSGARIADLRLDPKRCASGKPQRARGSHFVCGHWNRTFRIRTVSHNKEEAKVLGKLTESPHISVKAVVNGHGITRMTRRGSRELQKLSGQSEFDPRIERQRARGNLVGSELFYRSWGLRCIILLINTSTT